MNTNEKVTELVDSLYALADRLEREAIGVRGIAGNWKDDIKPTFDEVNEADKTADESIHEETRTSAVESEQ